MRKSKKVCPAYTGTSTRMKHLPYAAVSSLDNFNCSNQAYSTVSNSVDYKIQTTDATCQDSDNWMRKCVYTYEDKYAFSRIIYNDSLVFDSHFESANLHSAFRVLTGADAQCGSCTFRKHIYDLYMHNDLYTAGNTQWYYFRKAESLYSDGMRPLWFSTRGSRGWERCGTNIQYEVTTASGEFSRISGQISLPTLYTLSFTHIFDLNDDVCYFAYCLPYTYTDLQKHLLGLQNDCKTKKSFRRKTLCKTIAGNSCDLLTITAPASSPEVLNKRIVVFLSARVHPGETNSSWIMHGMLNFLTSSMKEACELRELYIFKVIPMLNPDGVINGNYRTSLAGCDLNRKWSNPDPYRHPTIFHTKELMKAQKKLRTIGIVLDLHGHSRKKGIFVYGCLPDKRLLYLNAISNFGQYLNEENIQKPKVQVAFNGGFRVPSKESKSESLRTNSLFESTSNRETVVGFNIRQNTLSPIKDSCTSLPRPGTSPPKFMALCGIPSLLPWVSELPPSAPSSRDIVAWKINFIPRIFGVVTPTFDLKSCSFKMHKSKAGTMRIVAFSELGIDCVYTVEASLAGGEQVHYAPSDLMQMGQSLCCGLLAANPCLSLDGVLQNSFRVDGASLEALAWRKFYQPEIYALGAGLMSEAYLEEMIHGTNEQFTDDSDNDTVALERASLSARPVQKTKAVRKKLSSKSQGLATALDGDPEKDNLPIREQRKSTSKPTKDSSVSKVTMAPASVGAGRAASTKLKPRQQDNDIVTTRKEVPKKKGHRPPTKKAMELSVVGSRAVESFSSAMEAQPPATAAFHSRAAGASDEVASKRIQSAPIIPRKSINSVATGNSSMLYMDDTIGELNASNNASGTSHISSKSIDIDQDRDRVATTRWFERSERSMHIDKLDSSKLVTNSTDDQTMRANHCSRQVQPHVISSQSNGEGSPRSPFSSSYQSEDARGWSSVVGNYLQMLSSKDAPLEGPGTNVEPPESQTSTLVNTCKRPQSGFKLAPTLPSTIQLELDVAIPAGGTNTRALDGADSDKDNRFTRRPQSASASRGKLISSSATEFTGDTNTWFVGGRGQVVSSYPTQPPRQPADSNIGAIGTSSSGISKLSAADSSVPPQLPIKTRRAGTNGHGTIVVNNSHCEDLELGISSNQPTFTVANVSAVKSTVGIIRNKY